MQHSRSASSLQPFPFNRCCVGVLLYILCRICTDSLHRRGPIVSHSRQYTYVNRGITMQPFSPSLHYACITFYENLSLFFFVYTRKHPIKYVVPILLSSFFFSFPFFTSLRSLQNYNLDVWNNFLVRDVLFIKQTVETIFTRVFLNTYGIRAEHKIDDEHFPNKNELRLHS